MGTKLKNFSLDWIVKGFLFLLIIASMTTAVVQLQTALLKGITWECLVVEEYHKSDAFFPLIADALEQVTSLAYKAKELEEVPFYYYFSEGPEDYTNTGHTDKEFYEQYDRAFFYLENGVWKTGTNTQNGITFYNQLSPNYVAYVAFPYGFLNAKQQEWEQYKRILLPNIKIMLGSSLIGFLLLLALCFAAGRRHRDNQIYLYKIDKTYTEVLLLILGFGIWLFIEGLILLLGKHMSIGIKMDMFGINLFKMFTTENLSMAIFIGVITTISGVIFLNLLLSIIRKLKAGIFIKDSLICKLLQRIYRMFSEIINYLCYGKLFTKASITKNLYYRQQIFIVATIIAATLTVLLVVYEQWTFLLPLFAEIMLIIWYTLGNKKLYEDINNDISESLEEQMKSERMKVALVTNVSHDLKTPLTSIISFIDLLSKEKDLSETSLDYVRILEEKSDRLKNIVNDLFELAKSTSGNVSVNYDYLDLKKLMIQTLADMEDRIKSSHIQFKTKLPDEPVSIYSDGKKLYRVFQNLIDNTLKYTLKDTRVYIDMEQKGKKVITTVKNVAGYDMNFTSQEILQRFSRGDQSRSTEGSGLGLSIADSFTKVCGGDFQVVIDGDLFKVIISFDIATNDRDLSEKG